MISFLNDYNEVGHPEFLDELIKHQNEKFVGYSEDSMVKKAVENIKNKLKYDNVDIHFVQTGTIANVLSLLFTMNRYESVISVDTGHIVNTENASVEAVGHQIVLVPEVDGKVTPQEVEKALVKHSHEYNSKPSVVYISNATELGTIYKRKDLEELSNCCKENGLYLFLDGARLASSLMSDASDLKFEDLPKYLDIFTIGGIKNGMLFGEAIVIVNDNLKTKHERRIIKQRGTLLSKGFLYGIQFARAFEDNLYFDLGKHSSKMAIKIKEVFETFDIKPEFDVEANIVFVKFPKEIHDELSKDIVYSYSYESQVARFVTSWNTKVEEIEKLKNVLEQILS